MAWVGGVEDGWTGAYQVMMRVSEFGGARSILGHEVVKHTSTTRVHLQLSIAVTRTYMAFLQLIDSTQ